MKRTDIRQAWEEISETYARRRDPDGPDATLIEELHHQLPAHPRVLDLGCGDGARTLANLPAESIGIDIARQGLELAAETVPAAELIQADMEHLPFASNSFDGLTAYHSVFHVPRAQHPAVYAEIARVLRPGGKVLMTLPGGRYETVRRGWMGGQMLFSAPGRDQTLQQLTDAGIKDLRTITTDDPLGSRTECVIGTVSKQ